MNFSVHLRHFVLVSVLAFLLPSGAVGTKCKDALQPRLDCYDTDGPCDPLPVPDSSFGRQPDPVKGYFIETLRDGLRHGIYGISEGSYWFMVAVSPFENKNSDTRTLRGGRPYEVAIFDMPEGSFAVRDEAGQVVGSLITDAIDEIVFDMHQLTKSNIHSVKMIYSHQHFDHIGAATIVYDHVKDTFDPESIEIIAHEEVKKDFETRIEAEFFSFRAPLPTTLVETAKSFTIGKEFEFSLTATRGHTDDKDLVVFFEKNKDGPAIMMFVDVIFPKWAPFFSFAITTDLFHYLKVHDFLLEEFDLGNDGIFVGGHLTQLGSRVDIAQSSDYAHAVMDGAREGLQSVDINPIAASSGVFDPTSPNVGNQWLLFDLYFKEIVRICAKKVVAEYGCVLAGVDITVESACVSAQSYWRIDF